MRRLLGLSVVCLALGSSTCASVLGLDEDRTLAPAGGAGGGNDGGAGGAAIDYPAAVKADGPLAYFRFEEASGPFVDTMKPDRSMSPLGDPTHAVPGAVGNAVAFAGGSQRAVLSASAFPFLGKAPSTIEVWVRADPAHANDFQDVVNKYELLPADNGYALRLRPTVGFVFTRADQGTQRNVSAPAASMTQGYDAFASFVHVVVTFDGTTSRTYVDGVPGGEVLTSAGEISVPMTDAPFRIGGLETGNPFFGALDELAIYGEALSEEKVRAHFEARGAP